MLELIGLAVVTVSAALVLLPFVTFFRLRALGQRFTALEQRVRDLEAVSRQRADAPAQTPAVAVPPLPREDHRPAASVTPPPAAPFEAIAQPGGPVAGPVAAERSPFDAASEGGPDTGAAPWGDAGARVAPDVPTSPPPPTRPSPLTQTPAPLDLEDRVGGHWLLYAGVLILLLGVSFFLKYAFDNEWVGPWGRVLLGAVAGLALVALGLSCDRRGLVVFGRTLAGAGFAALYLSVYAAFDFYALIGGPVAFGLMVVVTGAAALTADRRQAWPLAVIAVIGGFVTPFLVGGQEDAQIVLFSYDALLILGTLFLSRRQHWVGLNVLAYALTVFTAAAWAGEHYTRDKWVPTLLFLTLFCGLFVVALRDAQERRGRLARAAVYVLWTGPALYHLCAIAITTAHPPAFHVYLIVVTLVSLLTTTSPPRPWVRLALLFAVVLPMLGHIEYYQRPSWLVANLATIVAICGLHLFALVSRSARGGGRLHLAELIALHVAGLALFGLLQETLSTRFPAAGGSIALAVAAVAALLARAFRGRDQVASLNAAGLACTLVAAAIALQFDGRVVVIGWAAEGAVIAWLGWRTGMPGFVVGGLGLWVVAALKLTDGYFMTPVNFTAVFNERSLATLAVIALGYALVWAARRGAAERRGGEIRIGLHVACSVLSILWISAEVHSYWDLREDSAQAYLYEQLLLSLGWGLYGACAIVLGMLRAYPPLRYIGIVVILVTVLKVFFVDLWELGGIYRVIGFLALGVLLVLLSYLYQQRRLKAARAAPDAHTG